MAVSLKLNSTDSQKTRLNDSDANFDLADPLFIDATAAELSLYTLTCLLRHLCFQKNAAGSNAMVSFAVICSFFNSCAWVGRLQIETKKNTIRETFK